MVSKVTQSHWMGLLFAVFSSEPVTVSASMETLSTLKSADHNFRKGVNILRSTLLVLIKSSPIIVRSVLAIILLPLLVLCNPVFSNAASLTGDSSTYVQSKELADGSKILAGYEYLDFAVQDIGNETISFHTGGWLREDFQTEEFGKKSNSDLQYSYLSFKSKTDNTVVNLGRVMVFEGVAAERVDGIYGRTDMGGGFGVSVFGGSPVETEINPPGDNVIYGARLSHQVGDIYKIGISALEEDKNSQEYRKEAGIDLWLHPISNVDITGRSSYNDITKGWMENTYVLMLGPFAKLRFDTTASWINYDDYFFRVTTSALSLGPSGLNVAGEKVEILGESASYQATDNVSIVADYKNYDYRVEGDANYYGGMVKYSVAGSGGAGVGYHKMDGNTDRLKYDEYRVYGNKKLGKFGLTADLLEIVYANPINGVKDSYSGTLAALYDITDAWKLGVDVDYYHDPNFTRDVRSFVKLLYHFGTKGGA
jgi:hypothetical protein